MCPIAFVHCILCLFFSTLAIWSELHIPYISIVCFEYKQNVLKERNQKYTTSYDRKEAVDSKTFISEQMRRLSASSGSLGGDRCCTLLYN